MGGAMKRYVWEEEDFDLDSFYPPIPEEYPWLRKLLESTRNKAVPEDENTEHCPVCTHPDYTGRRHANMREGGIKSIGIFAGRQMERGPAVNDVESLGLAEHPVWDMDPIPCPFHILDHLYGPPPLTRRPTLITRQKLESSRRFLAQMRESRGYYVDTFPQQTLICNGLKPGPTSMIGARFLDYVVDHIKAKTGEPYELVEVKRVVFTFTFLCLVTFTAAPAPAPARTDSFLATINLRTPDGTGPCTILECLLQPEYNAPMPDHLPVFQVPPLLPSFIY